MSTLTLEFAHCRYRLTGLLPEQERHVRARFGALECPAALASDVEIEVVQSPEPERFMARPIGPVEYRVAMAYGERQIAIAGIGFSAAIERASFRTQMQTCLGDEWFLGAFENLLRVVAAYRLFSVGALVIHSAALSDGERGFLFCGRSGAGKTTICVLADTLRLTIFSDELNAIVPSGESFSLQAMPFAGDFGGTPVRHPPFPLTGLLGLEHALVARLDTCSQAQAVSRIVASCPYLNADPMVSEQLTERAVQLVDRIPLRVLSFATDTTFWSVLDHEYRIAQAALPR